MSGSTENRAQDASEKPGRKVVLNLATARRMLPLVQRVVSDLMHHQSQLAQLRFEQGRLDRQRRTLTWPQRCRRYQVREDIAASERALQDAIAELASLAVVVLDPVIGRVGFPTLVDNRGAFFSWQPGEDTLHYWQFPEDATLRLIPAHWAKAASIRQTAKS
jgi:hypothetical protein